MAFKGVFPPPKAVPLPYGLFSAAEVVKHSAADDHWAGGYGVDSETCNVGVSYFDYCGGDPVTLVTPTANGVPEKIQALAIRVEEECLSIGWDVQDRRARIMRQLELATPKAVEAELWNGEFAIDQGNDNQYLSKSSVTTVTSGAVKPKLAVALLEQAMAECGLGTQGVIHVTPAVFGVAGGDITEDTDKSPITHNGNRVAVGSGYDGRGPGATTPPANITTSWIYATGPVVVHLGAAELMTPDNSTALNISTNEMKHIGVRPASVFWDGCCHFAAEVDLTL